MTRRVRKLTTGGSKTIPRTKRKKSVCENAPELLYRIAKAMATVSEGRELLKIIVEYTKPVFDFYDLGLFVLDKNGEFFLDWASFDDAHDSSSAHARKRSKFPDDEPFLRAAIERAAREKSPFVENLDVAFAEKYADFSHLKIESGCRQLLATTLQAGGKTLGVLNFNSRRAAHFAECDFELFQAVADLVAPAIANIQAREEIAEREREKEAMLAVSKNLATIRDKNDLFRIIAEELKPIFDFDEVSTVLYDADFTWTRHIKGRNFVVSAADETHNRLLEKPTSLENSPYLEIAKWKSPRINICADVAALYPDFPGVKVLQNYGFREFVSMPLRYAGKLLGVFEMHSLTRGKFSRRQIPLYAQLADQIAVAVSNIQANEEILEQAREKEIFLKIAEQAAKVRDFDEFFALMTGVIQPFLKFDDFVITKLSKDKLTRHVMISQSEIERSARVEHPTMIENMHRNLKVADDPWTTGERIYERIAPTYHTVAGMLEKYPDYFWAKMMRETGLAATIAVTLRHRGETIGGLYIHYNRELENVERLFPVVEAAANQIATVIANLLANEEIIEQTREKSALLEISEAISAVRNRDELFETIIAKVQPLYDFNQYTNICVYDRRTDSLQMFFTEMSPFEQTQSAIQTFINPFPVEGIFRKIAQTGEVVIMDEEWLNSPKSSEVDEKAKQIWRDLNLNYNLSAALRSFDQLIGTFHIHFFEPRTFTPAQLRLFKAIADQIAVAVSNILGNEEIQTQFAEIKSLKKRLEAENVYLAEEVRKNYNFEEIIGTSPNLHHVFEVIEQVAPTDATVLISGETGTGKELIARAIHNRSPRNVRPLIKINCATLPKELIESELFGHERGAFTGATEKRVGKFELANQGTIFLDEIGELPLEMQVKLLRVLQEREIERVGGKGIINLDLRVVAATNRNLAQEVQAGRFRADLYYRLCTVEVFMPPLRERREDIEPLTMYFAQKYAAKFSRQITCISSQMLAELNSYDFPGNIRELEHIVEHAVIFSKNEKLMLPRPLVGAKEIAPVSDNNSVEETETDPAAENLSTLESVEREHILSILRQTNGKIKGANGAAKILGLNPATVYFRMKKLGIQNK